MASIAAATVTAEAASELPAPAATQAQRGAAFQRLYPGEYYARFLQEGFRPDGRPPGRPRPISIGLGSIETADSSALVKVGSATALACIKVQVMVPDESRPGDGQLVTTVELTPMSSPDVRPGRPPLAAQVLNAQLEAVLQNAVDNKQLCIADGKAAWLAYLDIYILDADGSLFDVSLLAAVAALQSLRLPRVAVNDEGTVVPLAGDETTPSPAASAAASVAAQGDKLPDRSGRVVLREVPIGLTVGWHGATCIVDPSAAETKLLASVATVVLDADGSLLGLHKVGGEALASAAQVQDCIAHARLRYGEAARLLTCALSEQEALLDQPTTADMEQ